MSLRDPTHRQFHDNPQLMSRYNYTRRKTTEVRAGNVGIGAGNPIRLQSMTNTSTLDTEASARQVCAIAAAGGEIVRLTTQGEREAANMAAIRVRSLGVGVPRLADGHFNPKAAYRAAAGCEKVRINPGNFVDAARTFRKLGYTDEEYAAEQERIRAALLPLLDICRPHGTALRLGVNHGSLSDRIMSRYGDTAPGMAESAMEFLRVCRDEHFDDVVLSVKASNTAVMTETVRCLVAAMDSEDMHYPLHLGVTEAGDGEDGRVKSAVGIGTLLTEGTGDTIRVSLSEPPENELPVARHLRDYICRREGHAPIVEPETVLPGTARSHSAPVAGFEHLGSPLAVGVDIAEVPAQWHTADASDGMPRYGDTLPVVLSSSHVNPVGEMSSWIDRFAASGGKNPVILRRRYCGGSADEMAIEAAADLGALLLNGYGSGIALEVACMEREDVNRLSLGILQASRLRFSKTEYIACPSCGRTLFDLPQTLAQVRCATAHLKGLKIGVMGCIVNGPGEMADADYGYVGAGPGRVSIYRGKELLVKNIPAADALRQLTDIIRADGRWVDP